MVIEVFNMDYDVQNMCTFPCSTGLTRWSWTVMYPVRNSREWKHELCIWNQPHREIMGSTWELVNVIYFSGFDNFQIQKTIFLEKERRPKANTRWWQLKYVFFHPYLGKISNLTSIFFKWVGSTTNQFCGCFTFAKGHVQPSGKC